jgi:predicted nucleotidyltransferase component of viral defense system
MMNKTEIGEYKTYEDPYQVEKDYLQDLMLHTIYSKSEAQMVFKGGTALSKFYYSGRFSEDLDFTLRQTDAEPLEYVKRLLEDIIRDMEYPVTYRDEPRKNRFGTISASLAVEGPRYDLGRISTVQYVRFEINTTGSTIFPPVNMSRQPKYRDVDLYLAPVMDKRDILAEKVRALMSSGRRHKERDLYDMRFIMEKGGELKKEYVLAKLKESGIDYSSELLSKNIDMIRSTWDQLEPLLPNQLMRYDVAKGVVRQGLEKAGLL